MGFRDEIVSEDDDMMKVVEEDVGKENHTNCGRTGRAANGPKWVEGGERVGRTRAKANRMDGVRAGKGRLKELRA